MNKVMSPEVGQSLKPSDWILIDQDRINQFADATGDHQFIHVDPKRAAETPFNGTIAHGFLTLSLLPHLLSKHRLAPPGTVMSINYGCDHVRFLEPVPVGSEVRAAGKITEVTEKRPGHWLVKTAIEVEIKASGKLALVAEMLSLFVVNQEE